MQLIQLARFLCKLCENDQDIHGHWDQLPEGILQTIMDQLNYGDCVRLAAVCKSWRSIVKQTNVLATPRIPWLWLLFHSVGYGLRFYDFYEGRFYKFNLPEILAGSLCGGASKGWVVLLQHAVSRVSACESQSYDRIFLYNPISGDQFQVPSSSMVEKIELSTVDASNLDCMIAAIFYGSSLLAICGRQDENWSVYDYIDDETCIADILYLKGVLYVLVVSYSSKQETQSDFATCTMRVGDRNVILKIIPCNGDFSSCFVESEDDRLWIALHTLGKLEMLPIDVSNSIIGTSTRLNKPLDQVLLLSQGRSLSMSTTYFLSPYNKCVLCDHTGNYDGLVHIVIHSQEEEIKEFIQGMGLCSKTWFTPNIF